MVGLGFEDGPLNHLFFLAFGLPAAVLALASAGLAGLVALFVRAEGLPDGHRRSLHLGRTAMRWYLLTRGRPIADPAAWF